MLVNLNFNLNFKTTKVNEINNIYSRRAIMSRFIKFLSSLLWSTEDEDDNIPIEQVYKLLERPERKEEKIEPLVEECQLDDYQTTLGKTGVITNYENGEFTIDNIYKFKSDSVYLKQGSKVSYNLFQERDGHKVSNVNLIQNEWEVIEDKTSKWCLRTLVCKTTRRHNRTVFTEPYEKLRICLDEVASDFVPKIGDWLQLEAKCEVNKYVADQAGEIYDILKISPLRQHIRQCIVTHWNEDKQKGVLDKIIYFDKDSIGTYKPVENESVTAEVIESDQNGLTMRALKVVPNFLKKNAKFKGKLDGAVEIQLELQVDGIELNKLYCLNFTSVGEKQKFQFLISNKLDEDVIVNSITFPRFNSGCELITNCENMVIASKGFVEINYACTSTQNGKYTDYMFISTSKGDIGHWLEIFVRLDPSIQHGKYIPQKIAYKKFAKNTVIKGESVFNGPRFRARSMPEYTLTQRYIDLMSKHGTNVSGLKSDLGLMKPCLLHNLTFDNYLDKLHSLLYIEEIQHLLEMSRFEEEQTALTPIGDYLAWRIENLLERKPTLMIGDKVYLEDPYNADVAWEGYVHNTDSNYVYLKFSHYFHKNYNGEGYNIYVESSRTSKRRLHFAVDLAIKYQGIDLLFPSKLQLKKPQICLDTPSTEQKILKEIAEHENTQEIDKYCNNKVLSDSPTSDDEAVNRRGRSRKEMIQRLKEYNKKSPVEKENYKNEILNVLKDKSSSEDESDVKSRSSIETTPLYSNTIKIEWYNKDLNRYQKEAVVNVLKGEARPLPYVIFGPPGTGKTVTLVECILQILRLIPSSRILVAAPSNSAADLMSLRLIRSEILKPGDLVRFISYRHLPKITAELAPYCATGNMAKEGTNTHNGIVMENGVMMEANAKVLGRHRVTITTCSSAGALYMMDLPRDHFSHIVVDEAGQALEPEILIPLAFLTPLTGQVILAGDPMQLGPVVISSIAKDYGLQTSYLERLLDRFPYSKDTQGFPHTNGYHPKLITKLLYNYRSVPTLLKLTSSLFYDDDLIPVLSEDSDRPKELLDKLVEVVGTNPTGKTNNIVFHGIIGDAYQSVDTPSWFNPSEIGQVFFYVTALYNAGMGKEDIGIISPYVKQVKEIRKTFLEAQIEVPKVGSIEEFQGQEFSVIILSTVRSTLEYNSSNLYSTLGFISDSRRLNVALSRAKVLLIIIGNPDLLAHDVYWRQILNYVVRKGRYLGCPVSYKK